MEIKQNLINPSTIPVRCIERNCIAGGITISGETKDGRWEQWDCPFKIFQSRLKDSGLYEENKMKFIEDFNWNLYGKEDVQRRRQIVESFVFNMEYWIKNKVGLYFHSETTGSGKTYLASIILNEAALQKYNILFLDCDMVIRQMTDERYRKSNEEFSNSDDISAKLQFAEIVVLDEIGVNQSVSQNSQRILLDFINSCSNKGIVIIYTSNVPLEKLNCGSRIADRIARNTIAVCLPEVNIRNARRSEKQKAFLEKALNYKRTDAD